MRIPPRTQPKPPRIIFFSKAWFISYFGSGKEMFIVCAFLTGIILMWFEIQIYRFTFVPFYIPLSIFLIPGILLTPFLYRRLNDIGGDAHWILHYVLHTCMTGGLLTFAFMYTNMRFTKEPVRLERFEIINKGALGGRHHREYAVVKYHGFEKELFFSDDEEEALPDAGTVLLTLSRGLWGFDVVEDSSLE